MTPADFRAWLGRLGLSQPEAATALGVTRSCIVKRLAGKVRIALETELACRELERQHNNRRNDR
jgi:predicted XRE-type DNA-binding protein